MDSIKISEAGKWHRGASDGRCLLSHLWVLVASTSLRGGDAGIRVGLGCPSAEEARVSLIYFQVCSHITRLSRNY